MVFEKIILLVDREDPNNLFLYILFVILSARPQIQSLGEKLLHNYTGELESSQKELGMIQGTPVTNKIINRHTSAMYICAGLAAFTLSYTCVGRYSVNMLFFWILMSCFLQILILVCSYRSWCLVCLVRKNYLLTGEGNVVIAGFFPAFSAYPLNKTTDWRITKFTRDFMIE